MSDAISVSVPISGTDRTLSFEAGKLAQLADGAVLARIGDTILLATVTAARSVREGTDFFPLTVDIEERTYAAGKIPGSFFRREGKSSDQAILTDRLIDRPLRPSFPEGFRNEVHVVGTIVGADQVNPHDVLAINAASAALMISGIPFDGPIGAVRIAYTTEGVWIPHPTFQEGEESTFELVVAGRALSDDADSEIAIMMVEAGGTEKSWSYYDDGRTEGHRGGAGGRARGVQAVDPRVHQPAAPPRGGLHGGTGADRDHPLLHLHRLPGRRMGAGGGRRHRADRQGQPGHQQGRAQRGSRRGRRGDPRRPRRRVRRPPRRGQGGHPLTDQEAGAQADRRGRCPGRRPGHLRHPAALGGDRLVPDGARIGTLPARRDPGAQRDDARHAAHEPAARHDHPGRDQALHAPLQLPALLDR